MLARALSAPKSRVPLQADWLRSGESQAAASEQNGQLCVQMRGMWVGRGAAPKLTALR
jgi:hypothetical protein